MFPPQSSTFEFPIYSSLAEVLGALELVVWDKNKFTKKEYLGEVAIPVVEWFPGTALTFDDPGNAVRDAFYGGRVFGLSICSPSRDNCNQLEAHDLQRDPFKSNLAWFPSILQCQR